MDKKPNFFILGAPKCGTTALAQWLGEHPNIYTPPVKEPHFYSTDLANRQARTRNEYDRLFKAVTSQHKAIGEASVWYLYSEDAVPNILKEIPDAKFIVCLRNPVHLAYSLHGQHVIACNEDIQDFEKAWEAQSQRQKHENVPRLCVDSKLLLYGSACALGSQLERLYASCDSRQIHCVFLDDIKQDADGVYRSVLNFLSVADDGRQEFPTVNAASQRRSQRLARLVKSTNWARRRMGIPRIGTGIMRRISYVNQKKSQRPPMKNLMKMRLANYFRADVEKLEAITGRCLDHWKRLG